jgi:hypothetical protein
VDLSFLDDYSSAKPAAFDKGDGTEEVEDMNSDTGSMAMGISFGR